MIESSKKKINLLDLNPHALETFVQELGEPRFRAQQLIQWIHQRGVTDFNAMTNLSKKFRELLHEHTFLQFPEIAFEKHSDDGTIKWLFRLNDGNMIETVFIPEATRGTLCVSSQVGCALNCSFCATGKEGFNRNLTFAEIIGQVWVAAHRLSPQGLKKNQRVSNVVMMGMGEPLLNYDAVVAAMTLMMSDHAYNLSKYRVTLSTAGVVPALKKLREDSPVALAVSLHAPTDELRDQLVPLNRKYPLAELMAVCRDYFPANSKRRVTFEYVMLDGINDTLQHAEQLVRLVKNIPCKMNLIPFNPFAGSHYHTSSGAAVIRFQNYLNDAGVMTWVRKTRGDDIEAACGQLAGQIQDRTGRNKRWLRTGKLVPMIEVSA